MPNVFFFSHASPNQADTDERRALDRFFWDLENAVARLIVTPKNTKVGFWDCRDIGAGVDFQEHLRSALERFPIGVVVLDPAYLSGTRPFCFWEFSTFKARNVWAKKAIEQSPRCLLIVDWVEVNPNDFPNEFDSNIQRVRESIAKDEELESIRRISKRGLFHHIVLALSNDDEAKGHYIRFVNCLARYIDEQYRLLESETWRAKGPPPVPPYDENASWSAKELRSAGKPGPQGTIDRKTVVIVAVAARPKQINSVAPTRNWRYKEDGEEHWRPFAREGEGSAHRLIDIVNRMCAENKIEGEIKRVTFSPYILEELENLEQKYPVVIIVDPWTIGKIDNYKNQLRNLATAAIGKIGQSTLIVIWNDFDPDITIPNSKRIEFESEINQALSGCESLVRASHVESLYEVLESEVERLRQEIRKSSRPSIDRPSTPKPTVSASE